MSGVAMQRSKSIAAALHLFHQVFGADDIGTRSAGFIQPWRRGRTPPTRSVRPVPFGSVTTPRTIWSA